MVAPSILQAQFTTHGQAKPKKRKLGGHRDRSFFDEDEEALREEADLREVKNPGRKVASDGGRNPVLERQRCEV